jgi:hypothetical protein
MILFGRCTCNAGLPITQAFSRTLAGSIAHGDVSESVNASVAHALNLIPGVVYRVRLAFGFPATSLAQYFCANGTGRITLLDAESGATDFSITGEIDPGPDRYFNASYDGGLVIGESDLLLASGITTPPTLSPFLPLGAADSGYFDSAALGSANTILDISPGPEFPPSSILLRSGDDPFADPMSWHLAWARRNLIPALFNGTNYLVASGRVAAAVLFNPCATPRAIQLRFTYSVGKEGDAFWNDTTQDDFANPRVTDTRSYLLVHVAADLN